VAVLTAITGGAIGLLAWREQRATSTALVDAALLQASRLAAEHVTGFFHEAESTARLGPEMVARGLLDPDDERALSWYVLAVLRSHRSFSWVSYGDRQDRFVGAWRDAQGAIYLNRSFPRGPRIRLEEDRIFPDGRREPVRRSDDHGYRPRDRPYYQLAMARRAVTWTEPYEFYAGGGIGITCVAPLFDRDGDVQGVFTVDLSLDALSGFLAGLPVSARGRAFVAGTDGRLLAAPDVGAVSPHDAALAREVGRSLGQSEGGTQRFRLGDEAYLGRAVSLTVGDWRWLVAVVAPGRDFTERVDAQARRSAGLAAIALVLAIAAGVLTARRLARPLQELAALARRIREGDLTEVAVPTGHDEIGTLGQAMADMTHALRERDFVRDTLGRYVSPELAARFLRDRDALRLGGELREVSILMSDLRGFSPLSERLGPERMIELLNRYLGHMTRVILAHEGTINEFVGDAILVLFGAPVRHPDDAARALRCAWAMQVAMRAFNEESRGRGLPEVVMGIGVHTGTVVAGNIGSAEHVKYGVVGPAVNLTARIEALTVGPQVLVSAATLAQAPGVAVVGPPREVSVKGASAPVTVHELLGIVSAQPPEVPPDGPTADRGGDPPASDLRRDSPLHAHRRAETG
jgi:sigma-B regulation protein RsbU (phosphoserine phosphatase)